eukprot:snap_masked-scaffold_46-processed-gene-1.79-mRNA-1 protein AED:1.00 eAED:1.00 QI:0/-1/0/0/-1/1/1/0/125
MFDNNKTFDKRVNFQSSNDIIFLQRIDYSQVSESLRSLSKELYYPRHINFRSNLPEAFSTRMSKVITPYQVSDRHFENLSTKDVPPILIKNNLHDLPAEFKEIGLGKHAEPFKDEEKELNIILQE